jgi:hypothetical protein
MFLVVKVSTAIAGLFFGYPLIFYYYDVYFNITVDDWTPESIKIIYLVGPLMAILFGAVALIIYSNLKEYTFQFKIFFLWAFIHAMSMVFGALLVGTLFDTGIGYAIGWMYVTDTGKLLYSIFSVFILVTAGFVITRQVLFSANIYYNEISDNNRVLFIHSQITLPFLLGVALLMAIRQPLFIFYDTFITFTVLLIILPIIGSSGNYRTLFFDKEDKRIRVRWLTVVITAFIWIAYRFVFESGVPIG